MIHYLHLPAYPYCETKEKLFDVSERVNPNVCISLKFWESTKFKVWIKYSPKWKLSPASEIAHTTPHKVKPTATSRIISWAALIQLFPPHAVQAIHFSREKSAPSLHSLKDAEKKSSRAKRRTPRISGSPFNFAECSARGPRLKTARAILAWPGCFLRAGLFSFRPPEREAPRAQPEFDELVGGSRALHNRRNGEFTYFCPGALFFARGLRALPFFPSLRATERGSPAKMKNPF